MILYKHIIPSEHDLSEIISLYIASFNAPEKSENWTLESAHAYFKERIAEGTYFFTARNENDQLIGVACGAPYSASRISREVNLSPSPQIYISLLAVNEQFRGQGQGAALFREFCLFLSANGYKDILVRCRAENTPMLNLLKKLKFTETRSVISELGGITCRRIFLRGEIQIQ